MELWKSPDLKKWDYLGLVCIDFDKDEKMIVNTRRPLLPGAVWERPA